LAEELIKAQAPQMTTSKFLGAAILLLVHAIHSLTGAPACLEDGGWVPGHALQPIDGFVEYNDPVADFYIPASRSRYNETSTFAESAKLWLKHLKCPLESIKYSCYFNTLTLGIRHADAIDARRWLPQNFEACPRFSPNEFVKVITLLILSLVFKQIKDLFWGFFVYGSIQLFALIQI